MKIKITKHTLIILAVTGLLSLASSNAHAQSIVELLVNTTNYLGEPLSTLDLTFDPANATLADSNIHRSIYDVSGNGTLVVSATNYYYFDNIHIFVGSPGNGVKFTLTDSATTDSLFVNLGSYPANTFPDTSIGLAISVLGNDSLTPGLENFSYLVAGQNNESQNISFFSVRPVPEPSTLALTGLGGVGWLLCRRAVSRNSSRSVRRRLKLKRS